MAEYRQLPQKPSKRDDIVSILTKGAVWDGMTGTYGDPMYNVPDYLLPCAVDGEWFDFGLIPNAVYESAFQDAMPFLDAGLIRLPYKSCVFRFREPVADPEGNRDDILMECLLVMVEVEQKGSEPAIACSLLSVTGDNRYELAFFLGESILDSRGIRIRNGADDYHARSGQSALALWLILNARGLRRTVDEPSEKLNKARLKNGKSPLKRVTHIDGASYFTALQETRRQEQQGGGTHASPRTHLRRAHLRYYEGKDKPVPIPATIVNPHKGDLLDREAYLIKNCSRMQF
jgi:hypothetical protein